MVTRRDSGKKSKERHIRNADDCPIRCSKSHKRSTGSKLTRWEVLPSVQALATLTTYFHPNPQAHMEDQTGMSIQLDVVLALNNDIYYSTRNIFLFF